MATSSPSNVVRLPKKRVRARPYVKPARRSQRRQHLSAVAVALVAVVLTALSLSHLAHGIALVTRAPAWEAWSMALGIDLGFIALEIAQLCAATERVRTEISRWTKPAILGTIVTSAAMNSLAFGAQSEGWMIYPAVGMGLAIPAMIYCLSRVAFGLAASR
jgi:hypothetical protein